MNARTPAPMRARWIFQRMLGLVVAGAASVAAAGCGPGFEPYNRLNSPRVLALKSDPVRPATGESTMLSAATYTPNDVPLFYDWSWCPVATPAGVACPLTDHDLVANGIPGSLHLTTDPAEPTATFTNDIPADKLAAICAGTAGFPAPDCTDGYPIQLQLSICTDSDPANCTDAAHAVQAVRPMLLRFRPNDQANANPAITGISALIAGMDQPADLQATPSPTLTRHKETVIQVDVDTDTDAEMYMGKDDNDNPALVYERLTLTWFVESGNTNHLRTSFIHGTTASGDATRQVKWTPVFKKDEKDSLRTNTDVSKIIVVIRDDRDGVSWIQGSAQLVEATTP